MLTFGKTIDGGGALHWQWNFKNHRNDIYEAATRAFLINFDSIVIGPACFTNHRKLSLKMQREHSLGDVFV